MLNKHTKIFVAGHMGMVGSSICKKLKKIGYKNIIVANRKKLDLLNQNKVYNYLKKEKPKLVIMAAAKVGGILANSKFKEKFLFENLQIQNNLIHGSYLAKVKNLIFLGSSCIYPRDCKQPMKENYIMTGKLEETKYNYLYEDEKNYFFIEPKSFEQIEIKKDIVGEKGKLLIENLDVSISFYNGNAISVELPNQISCKIKVTDAALKGQTVSSSYKPATLENGLNIQVPPFIESGDEIVVDTRTLEYLKKI